MNSEYKVTKEAIDDNSFYVCLVEVPDFPFNNERRMEVVRNSLIAVIGAVYDEGDGWSFTDLTKEEKFEIGDQLVELGAKTNDWFACTQYAIKENSNS